MAVITDESSPQNRDDQIRSTSLNHQAREFFPANYALVSRPPAVYPIHAPIFLHYPVPPLVSLHHPFEYYSAPQLSYYQPELQPQCFSAPEIAVGVPAVTKPLKAKEGNLYRNKNHLKGHRKYSEWRAKPSTGKNKRFDYEAPFKNPRKKVQDSSGIKISREKHALMIPLKSNGKETTVMIKNIPIRYTREMLKEFLDQHCMLLNREAKSESDDTEQTPLSAFDFLYLPIDFDTKSNKGYAFVNFTNPVAARKFFDSCHGEHWEYFKSSKIRQICCAKLQGISELIEKFERMPFPSQDFQPLSFNPARDGSKQSVEEILIGRYSPDYGLNDFKSK